MTLFAPMKPALALKKKVPTSWSGCTLDAPSDPYFNLLESAIEYIPLKASILRC